MAPPKIFITNDDGIDAPGIRHLWNALKDIADITIVAPATEQSAVGVGITLRTPLRINQVDWPEKQQHGALQVHPQTVSRWG